MVEANLVDEGKTITAEEYYDDPNNRAVVKLIQNDHQDFILLDYTANQIVYIVSKYKCIYGPCTDIMHESRGDRGSGPPPGKSHKYRPC